jgi:hypothetical protein
MVDLSDAPDRVLTVHALRFALGMEACVDMLADIHALPPQSPADVDLYPVVSRDGFGAPIYQHQIGGAS